jgi:hypothetical protein
MLPRGLVHDFFTQDPADRICGEERYTKWFIGREEIGNFEDAGFGAFATRIRRFVPLPAGARPTRKRRLARPQPESQTYQ